MLFRGYFDAASKEEFPDQPLVIAGTVATETGWAEFNRAWVTALEILGPPGVTHFHAVDCAHCRKEFAPWLRPDKVQCDPKFKPAQRRLLEELIEIMRRNILFVCTFWIKPADYNAVDQEYELETEFFSGAYSWAVTYATMIAERWVGEHFPEHEMVNVLEKGDTAQGKYLDLMHSAQSLGMVSPWTVLPECDKKTGKWIQPFGASDFVAYEHSLYINRKMRGNTGKPRGSYLALRRALPNWISGSATQEGIREWCESMPALYPRRDGRPSTRTISEEAEAAQRAVLEGREQIKVAERQLREMLKRARAEGIQIDEAGAE
jgi:hypothetical protein